MIDSRIPSQTEWPPYIYALRKTYRRPKSTQKYGKWLVFVPRIQLDEWWDTIAHATEDGLLGPCSKVSTAFDHPQATSPDESVICVYCPNSENKAYLRKVLAGLRSVGVDWRITYKPDSFTLMRLYNTGSVLYVSDKDAEFRLATPEDEPNNPQQI